MVLLPVLVAVSGVELVRIKLLQEHTPGGGEEGGGVLQFNQLNFSGENFLS